MENLRLIKPDITMADEIRAYREAMLAADSSMDGCGSLRRMDDPVMWLAERDALSREETLPAGYVPGTQYVCVRQEDGRIVGMIQLRHRFNDYLERFGGHIGYSVRPDERRKGYAGWMLRSLLPMAKDIGLSRVLITCLENNEASRRTILSCGGVYESTVVEGKSGEKLQRYWIDLE